MIKDLKQDKKGSVTIETAIVTSVFLLIIVFALSALFNVSAAIYKGCDVLNEDSEHFIGENRGNVLRMSLVIQKTGGKIINVINEK